MAVWELCGNYLDLTRALLFQVYRGGGSRMQCLTLRGGRYLEYLGAAVGRLVLAEFKGSGRIKCLS